VQSAATEDAQVEDTIFAASVALLRGPEVLLIERVKPPYAAHWTLPGGRLEPGESPEQCAIREIGEELGLTVSGLRPVLTMMVSPDFPSRLCVFATRQFAGTMAPSDEIATWRWLLPAAIGQLRTTPRLAEVVERAIRLFDQQ
jgi:8-oxo-dGTP pyrophosphatase MutT (NUDIX family)